MARISWKEEFEKAMRSSLIFHATKEDLRLVDVVGGVELRKREGGACHE